MPARIDDARRAAIEQAIAARDGRSRAQLARDHGVSPRSIQRYADALGLTDLWDTSGTRAATQSAADRRRARRSVLADRMLDEASLLLDQMHQPHIAFSFGGRDNEYNEHTFPAPPVDAKRNLMTTAAIALDKHLALDKHDADGGADEATSMLGKLATGLEAAYRALNAPPTPDEPPGEL